MDIDKAIEHFKHLVKTDEMAVSCLKPDEMEKSIQAEWLQYNKLAVKALQGYQPWIPVSERLPEEYHFVLISIFNGKATGVGMIDKKKRWYGIDHQEMDITPEAWKPLPEPPKGETP